MFTIWGGVMLKLLSVKESQYISLVVLNFPRMFWIPKRMRMLYAKMCLCWLNKGDKTCINTYIVKWDWMTDLCINSSIWMNGNHEQNLWYIMVSSYSLYDFSHTLLCTYLWKILGISYLVLNSYILNDKNYMVWYLWFCAKLWET